MGTDLSWVPDEDLEAIAAGDMSSVSEATLKRLAGESAPKGKGRLRAAGQGISFGFGDEIESAVTGTPVNQIRSEMRQFSNENPGEALGLEIAGGLPLMLIPGLNYASGVSKAKTAAPLLRQVATGAKVGALYGGLTGAGKAEGGLLERGENALLQGTAGGLLGAALPPVLQTSGNLAKAFGRHVGIGVKDTIQSKSDDLVLSAFERDRLTPDQVLAKLQAEGAPSTIADVAGEQTRGRMAGAMALPGQAQGDAADFINTRAAGAGDRLAGALKTTTGLADQDIVRYQQKVMDDARAAVRPLYEAAYSSKEGNTAIAFKAGELAPILKLEPVADAFARGQAIYKAEAALSASQGKPLPPLREIYAQIGDNAVWTPTGTQADVRTLDYLQRGLQDKIDEAYRSGQGGLAEQLIGVKKKINSFLEENVKEYAAARSIWRGGREGEEALDLGRKFIHKDPREIASEMSDMTGAARELYRVGAVDALRVQLRSAKDHSDVTAKLMSKEMRTRLRPLFPDEANYNKFLAEVSKENRLAATRRRLSGSRTTPLGAEMGEIEGVAGPAIGILESFLLGRWKSGVGQTAAALVRKATGLTQPVSEDITSRLLNPSPAANQAYLERLAGVEAARLSQNAAQTGRRAAYSAFAGTAPGLLQ